MNTKQEERIRNDLRQNLIEYARIFQRYDTEKDLENLANYIIVSLEDNDGLIEDANIWAEDMEEE